MFSEEQVNALKAPLDSGHVRTRAQAGRQLSYIEGWRAIDEANRIFGFDAWDRATVELRQLGDPREVDGKWRVAYLAKVRITVRARHSVTKQEGKQTYVEPVTDEVVRDGCGYGSGIDRDLGSAHESAIKEAETDAMKRALMTFGNPFGLALYDKEQRNVVDGNGHDHTPQPSKPFTTEDRRALEAHKAMQNTKLYLELEKALNDAETETDLKAIVLNRGADFEKLTDGQRDSLRKAYSFKMKALQVFHPDEVKELEQSPLRAG
jgi:recombination DNA repair RAD52 pathway protein